jgi:hypothetical protein
MRGPARPTSRDNDVEVTTDEEQARTIAERILDEQVRPTAGEDVVVSAVRSFPHVLGHRLQQPCIH